MKKKNKLYDRTISLGNLTIAWRKARKGKTQAAYVIEFEEELWRNLLALHEELKAKTYAPRPLETFILRDPKTRTISKSDFRDRIVHHALVNILEPIFDPLLIYDCCANRKGKGSLFALKRFKHFMRKTTKNGTTINGSTDRNHVTGYCLKADVKHYFEEIDHALLLTILKRKVADENLLWLVQQILNNTAREILGGGQRAFLYN